MIVPARNAAATLGRTLEALALQQGVEHETIVVDDASDDGTPDIAEAAGVRVIRHAQAGGAAAARNSGAAQAQAPVLAFTDADCEPDPDWLANGLKALSAADLVQGEVHPVADAGLFDRTLRIDRETGLYETANMFVKRELFESLGGFRPLWEAGAVLNGGGPRGLTGHRDERPWGEDTLFGWRARRSGASTGFAGDARVAHAVFPGTPADYVRERWRLRYFPTLVAHVPELRDLTYARVFQTKRRAAFDIAALGVTAAVLARKPWPLLAAVPYALEYLPVRRLPRRSAARETAALVVADAIGGAALLYGSARARELVL